MRNRREDRERSSRAGMVPSGGTSSRNGHQEGGESGLIKPLYTVSWTKTLQGAHGETFFLIERRARVAAHLRGHSIPWPPFIPDRSDLLKFALDRGGISLGPVGDLFDGVALEAQEGDSPQRRFVQRLNHAFKLHRPGNELLR